MNKKESTGLQGMKGPQMGVGKTAEQSRQREQASIRKVPATRQRRCSSLRDKEEHLSWYRHAAQPFHSHMQAASSKLCR